MNTDATNNSSEKTDRTDDRLAISGGAPLRAEPFAPWPVFDDEAIDAVSRVLKTGRVNYWTGDEGRRFEQEFADYVGTAHAVSVANGTLALELALYACGIGPADEVIVPSRTFVATATAVAARGAIPVFADVDPASQNLTAETIEALLTPRTRGVIAVHLAGWPCEMDPILELAARRGLKVIEDCAQAHGATYKSRPVGSLGDAAAFSFCQDKILTTGGEGGMLTTNDADVWRRAWSYKDHGKSWNAVHDRQGGAVFRWLHESLGTNWRLTEMQAALGRLFLDRLDRWVERRRQLASILSAQLGEVPGIEVQTPPPQCRHSYYKYYVELDTALLDKGWTRDRVVKALKAEGIPCGSGICSEIYLERAFDGTGWRPADRRPVARRLGETALMFQVHPTLHEADMLDTARAIRKVLNVALGETMVIKADAA